MALSLFAVSCAAGSDNPAAAPGSVDTATVVTPLPTASAAADAQVCAVTPSTPACQAFFDDLSDAEFCAIRPDDVFCIEFFDPDKADESDSGSAESTESAGRIELDGSTRLRPGTAPEDSDESGADDASLISDPVLRRNDGLCLPSDGLSEWVDADYDTAHQVVEGTLGVACHGMPDPRIADVWAVVHDIAPPELASQVAVFAGYFNEADTDRSRVGSAFVRPVGNNNDFLMAFNLADLGRTSQDPSVLVAHELAHLVAGSPDQIAGPPRTDCTTYVDGYGCRRADAIMTRWVAEFWPGVNEFDTADAAERCENDAGFFGEYAATQPAEDFAEAVAAYVTGVRAESFGQQDRLEFVGNIAAVRALRARAQDAGYEAAWYPFTICG